MKHQYFLSHHLPSFNLIRKTSSEVSLSHPQHHQHAVPTPYYSQHHQSPSRLNSTYQPDPHIGSTRRSLFVDDDVQLPLGHVQRLKKKLIVSLEERSNHVPSDLRVLPKRIPGAKDLFGGTRDTASQITSPAPLPLKRPPTKSEAISLRKSIASLAAAAALQRNESVRAKEVIVDGCGGERIHVVASPTHKLVSAQTQTELAGACPWWGVMLDGPVWRPRSMSFSAASSGIGMDDGSNFQEEFSSVSKNCWVCCKHSAAFAGGGGAGCGINQLQPGGIGSTTPDLLNEISRMIREEVTSVLQVEMANILDQQRDLIQQAIKPLAEENQADRKPSGSQGQPLQNSASAAAYPEFSSSSDTPLRESQLQQPTALPLEHSFHNSPSFLPEEETPVCPSCSLRCSDRFMLELHLDQCLK
uniref:UBZ4-type domain-containing protein n=1 Tax=Mesocestoides corti TaxID=53468 RepID=A0A5K3FTP6_MESCO